MCAGICEIGEKEGARLDCGRCGMGEANFQNTNPQNQINSNKDNQNFKSQITMPKQISITHEENSKPKVEKANNEMVSFEILCALNLRFICYLEIVIWSFIERRFAA